ARIAQSSALPPVADEPASPLRDASQGEACPTDSGFIADQDRATIVKSSTLPRDSAPRAQEVEINRLKERVKFLKDMEGVIGERFRDDAPIKGRRIDEEEVATERVSSDTEEVRLDEGDVAAERASEDTEEMATVLTTIDAATVLASGAAEVSTGSGSIPTAGPPATEVPTGSDVVLTASPVFATATMVTPYKRRKGKEVIVESETPKKQKLQEQIDAQIAKELKEQLEREDQKRSEQIARNEEIAKIHAEEELQIMIDGLDRSNEESAKKQKISEEVPEEVKSSDEVLEEKIKEMMQLVPIEEVYVEALQVKHPIIDWKVHTEGQRAYWKITRLGGSSTSYQFFIDLLKHLDRDDLNQLWSLVKESLSNRPPTTEWKLYEKCGVHQLTLMKKDIFMLVEKDYPLRKGLALVMICYKLQVENYSQMAENLVRKIYNIANSPRQQEEKRCHCQEDYTAINVKKKLSVKDGSYTKVLVTKPLNKTPYELLHDRTPSISFMRPFGCPVTILNTLDSLGKFERKNYDGDVVFDGKEHDFDAKKPESKVILSPSSSAQSRKQDDKTKKEAKGKSPVESFTGYRDLSAEFEDYSENSSNEVNAVGSIVPTVGQNTSNSTNPFSAIGPSITTASPTHGKSSFIDASQLSNDPDMPELEDITYSDDENDVGAEANFNNLRNPRGYIKLSKIQVGLNLCRKSFFSSRCRKFRLIEHADERQVPDEFYGGTHILFGSSGKAKEGWNIISQDTYVAEILRKFRLTEVKSASTPIDTEKPLLKDPDGEDVDVHTYSKEDL
nr:ribonuclease H-like domain-containing protein [Tanacetum cinerariifolium]